MPSGRNKRKGTLSMSSSNSTTGRKRLHRRRDSGREESESDRGKAGACRENKKRCSATAKAETAPSSCIASSPGACVRGLKRKSGCVDLVTRGCHGRRLEDEYAVGRAIGQGKFGSVKLCRSKTNGEEYACKTLLKNAGETVQREVEIMQHLSGHSGVVILKEVFEDHECFHLVMEMCSGGRLLDQMAKERLYTEHRAANVIKELVEIVKYCHEMGVVHRDIKPENILLTASGDMKLADFGLALRFTKGQQLSGFAGTPAYVAPEVLSGHYSEKVDIWSAGILLHALLVGVLPFRGDSRDVILEAVKNNELEFEGGIWEPISDLARDLIKQMLSRDVATRVTADQVLNHPWILFYTAQPHKILPNKLRARKNFTVRSILSEETVAKDGLCPDRPLIPYEDSSERRNKSEESGFANMLASAINRIQISEPKRIRLCSPASPITQECSSNLNNLLAAF